MIYAVDFDGTCVTHDYPRIGRDIGAVPVLKELISQGHQLILWTMRDSTELQDAINWFFQNEIPLFGVNENPEQLAWTESPKAYAHVYIDDLALGIPLVVGAHHRPFVDWTQVRTILQSLPERKL